MKKSKIRRHQFFAVVEQQLKKCCSGKLVLGCFFGLGFAASAGCGFKSTGKYGQVPGGTGTCGKGEKQKSAKKPIKLCLVTSREE